MPPVLILNNIFWFAVEWFRPSRSLIKRLQRFFFVNIMLLGDLEQHFPKFVLEDLVSNALIINTNWSYRTFNEIFMSKDTYSFLWHKHLSLIKRGYS